MSKIIQRLNLQNRLEDLYESVSINNGNAKYIINKYLKEIGTRSDYMILRDVCNEMKQYDWIESVDSFIKESIGFIKRNEISFGTYNTLESLKNSKYRDSYMDAINELEMMVGLNESSVRSNINKSLNRFKWIPEVKALIEMNDSINGSVKTTDANFTITNPVSAVYENEYGETFFTLGKKTYIANKDGEINLTNENEIPEEFLKISKLSENYKQTPQGLRMIQNGCIIDLKINENTGKVRIFVDGDRINESQLSAKLISTGKFRYGQTGVVSILEHTINKIGHFYSLGFIDTIKSNLYEGVEVNLIKTNSGIYINKINPSMNENVLIKPATTKEGIRIVKEFINYDITQSVQNLLEGDERVEYQRSEQERKIYENIKNIKDQISEISGMRMDNMPQIKEAKKLLQESLDEEQYKLNQLLNSRSRVINEGRYSFNVPINILKWAKDRDVIDELEEIVDWVTKAGKQIVGGTAIGKYYDTLILDLTHQGSEIYWDLDSGRIEVNDEEVDDYESFRDALEIYEGMNESKSKPYLEYF